MKAVAAGVALMILATADSLFAQGQVVFNNRITGVVDARFVAPDGTGFGAGYTAQLFGRPPGTGPGQLTPLFPTTTFRTTSAAAQGYVIPVNVTVPGIPPGAQATLVAKVFFGDDFDSACLRGESNPITITLGGGHLPPANLVGLQGFTIFDVRPECIPEPRTTSLLIGSLLAILHRPKTKEPTRE